MRPDLASLVLFVRIADTKSITKAAQASHIALAAASRRIAQLESQFNVQLLYRTARGVELTPAGSALLFHARQLMVQIDQMRAELSDFAKGVKGLVRIQANTSALAQFLAEDLASFSAAHPDVKISLEEQRSVSIVQAVHDGSTDIGIIMEGVPIEGLTCFDYRQDRLIAVLPKGHKLRGKRVSFAQLLDFDFVGLESNTVVSQLLADCAAAEQKPLRLRVQVKSFDVVGKMIQAGLGIGVLPEAAARTFAGAMGLRLVPLSDAWATRRMLLCVRNYKALPLIARQLVDHLLPAKTTP
jgi:DNA-binding transcriptional LysR family regulator